MQGMFDKRTFARAVGRMLDVASPALRRWARTSYFSPRPADAPLEKVLVLACHWLGDTFWATQLVPALHARVGPDAVWVATRPRSADLWRGLVARERILALEHVVSDRSREAFAWSGFWREAAALRAEAFDCVLDVTGNRYSALISFLARPRRAYGCGGDELAHLYSEQLPPLPAAAHLSLRPWYAAAPLLGPPPSEPRPLAPLPLPLDLEGSLRDVVARLGVDPSAPYAVLAPGAGWRAKRWPADRFAQLAAQLEGQGLGVVAIGGADERPLLETVLARTQRGQAVAGLDLGQTAVLLERARLVVANDSAIGHLAAAQEVPVVALFSPTNPARYRPLGRRVAVLQGTCPRRPTGAAEHCHGTPNYPCPPSCWDTVTTARVLAACQRLLLA